jgi:hypothetical protein
MYDARKAAQQQANERDETIHIYQKKNGRFFITNMDQSSDFVTLRMLDVSDDGLVRHIDEVEPNERREKASS